MADRHHEVLSFPIATFSGTTTTSTVVDLGNTNLVGLETPASFGQTSITFTVCDSSTGTFVPLNDDTGTALTVTVSSSAAGQAALNPADFAGVRFLKLVAGGNVTDKTVKLKARRLQ